MEQPKPKENKEKSVRNVLLKKKRKKEPKAYVTVIGAKQKTKKVKEKTQQILDSLRKAEAYYPDSVKSFFLTNMNKTINDKELGFYTALLQNSFYNIKININDIFGGKKFKYNYRFMKNFYETKVLSNDKLFWLALLKMTKSDNIDKMFGLYLKDSSLENLSVYAICDNTIQTDYKKGYIQDFAKEVFYLSSDFYDNRKVVINNKFADVKKVDFEYDKKAYSFYNKDNAILVFSANIKDVGEIIEKTIFIQSKSEAKNGIKIIKMKDDSVVYIQQKLVTTDFIPAVAMFELPLKIRFCAYFDIDYELLTKYMKEMEDDQISSDYLSIKEYEEKKDELHFGNFFGDKLYDALVGLVTWDNMDLFIKFLIFFNATVNKEEKFEVLFKMIDDFIKQYNDIKDVFLDVKASSVQYLRIVQKFYDSFQGKISIDTAVSLNKLFAPLFESSQRYDTSEGVQILIKFIEKNELKEICPTIYNTLKTGFQNVFQKIKLALDSIILYQSSTVVADVREAGEECYKYFIYTNNDFCINEPRTSASFLGDLYLKTVDEKKILAEFNKEVNKDEEAIDQEKDLIRRALITSNKEDVIEKGLNILLSKFGHAVDTKFVKSYVIKNASKWQDLIPQIKLVTTINDVMWDKKFDVKALTGEYYERLKELCNLIKTSYNAYAKKKEVNQQNADIKADEAKAEAIDQKLNNNDEINTNLEKKRKEAIEYFKEVSNREPTEEENEIITKIINDGGDRSIKEIFSDYIIESGGINLKSKNVKYNPVQQPDNSSDKTRLSEQDNQPK
jgi:hypothetical protein